MRRLILPILFSMFVTACGAVVRPDPSPINVIDANYPTVEMFACGKTWHGVGVCRARPADTVNVTIQGYFDGSMRVASPNCSIGKSMNYAESQKVVVSLPPSTSNCILVVTMSPRFPKGDNGVEVSSMRGYLAVRRDSLPNQWVGRAVKLVHPGLGNLRFPVGPITAGFTTIHGCGRDYNQPNNIAGKQASVRIQDFVDLGPSPDFCVADGNVFSNEYQTLLFNALVVTYSSAIAPLPIPVIEVGKDKIKMTADAAASAIAVDSEFKMGQKGSFDFDQSKTHVVRAMTAKGRTVIGVWSPSAKEFTWMQ